MRKQLAALAVLFLIAHLFFLPPTLEDVDSVNFALGVRDFDVAKHQPHPPGYPVFIGLAKGAAAVLRGFGVDEPEVRALALWSAISGAALVPILFALYLRLIAPESSPRTSEPANPRPPEPPDRGPRIADRGSDARVAWWAMAIAVCSPLLWFTALRPLSDVTGLAFAAAAQLALIRALDPGGGRALLVGAALSGLAAGVRVQTVLLTAPVLVAALAWPRSGVPVRQRLAAVGAGAAGVLLWAVPLIVASGGPGAYMAALGTQAGEDFSGVVMLWTTRQARVALNALLYSFVWPWGTVALGSAILAVAALGLVRAALRAPRLLLLLTIAYLLYAVFHLLFHETVTVRYALPLVFPIALLVAFAADAFGRPGVTVAGAVVVAAALAITVPAARVYGRDGSPAFRAYDAAGAASPGGAIGMHAVMRRVEEWERSKHQVHVLRAPHGREWLAVVEHWRAQPDADVLFVADPRRTDLALLDGRARTLAASERWIFPEMPFVGGTRPGATDVYRMRPPGWMLDRGWGLTAEVGGVTARQGLGPHVQPSVAWVRARPEAATLIVGGRNLGSEGDPAASVSLRGESAAIEAWDAAPGFFFRRVTLPAGVLAGAGYLPLRVSAVAADGSSRPVRVSLEQFDVQSAGTPMLGLAEGWHEPEYNPATAAAWRWASERAVSWVAAAGRDVTLTIRGESPLRYFDRAPNVRVSIGGVEVARFAPAADFTQSVTLPAAQLVAADGEVVLESDQWFSPADRSGAPDRRHLALRVYSIEVK